MKEELKYLSTLAIAGIVLFVAGGFLGGIIGRDKGMASCPQCPEIIADTVAAIDSAVMGGTAVRPEADTLIRSDSVPYPVPYPVYLPGDTICEYDTVFVYLPYDHRIFSIPDTLDVWYSGIDPCIDSAKVYSHTITVTNTVTVPAPTKDHRNTIGVNAGNADASVFYMHRVGKVFWIGASAGYTYDGQPTARGVAALSF